MTKQERLNYMKREIIRTMGSIEEKKQKLFSDIDSELEKYFWQCADEKDEVGLKLTKYRLDKLFDEVNK